MRTPIHKKKALLYYILSMLCYILIIVLYIFRYINFVFFIVTIAFIVCSVIAIRVYVIRQDDNFWIQLESILYDHHDPKRCLKEIEAIQITTKPSIALCSLYIIEAKCYEALNEIDKMFNVLESAVNMKIKSATSSIASADLARITLIYKQDEEKANDRYLEAKKQLEQMKLSRKERELKKKAQQRIEEVSIYFNDCDLQEKINNLEKAAFKAKNYYLEQQIYQDIIVLCEQEDESYSLFSREYQTMLEGGIYYDTSL